ncbi:MAG: monofunctional biosynthetic peptidoglycan transglycosylase [Deltaproteobacteria bacterium]|nr:monofunctional biosynthetic peptidoglycan transglycosylase [Deltaproteobacteria bacterium]MBW2179948.1 monofunctional biosynthetic peptidoglycan transglycosylase [Deltaproteobacteria bacterium]
MRKFNKSSTSISKFFRWVIIVFIISSTLFVLVMRWIPPPTTSFMLQRRFTAAVNHKKKFKIAYQWIDWKKIPSHTKLAMVAAEDQKFPHHMGFDLESIGEAVKERTNGIRIRGASTISQQVAKNLFLWPGQSFVRKGMEAYFTLLIEVLWPKRRILEVYLNIAEFGNGVFGVGAASRMFFKKSPAKLYQYQSALLAAVLPNPIKLSANNPSAYVWNRSSWVLWHMRLLGRDYLKGI